MSDSWQQPSHDPMGDFIPDPSQATVRFAGHDPVTVPVVVTGSPARGMTGYTESSAPGYRPPDSELSPRERTWRGVKSELAEIAARLRKLAALADELKQGEA